MLEINLMKLSLLSSNKVRKIMTETEKMKHMSLYESATVVGGRLMNVLISEYYLLF